MPQAVSLDDALARDLEQLDTLRKQLNDATDQIAQAPKPVPASPPSAEVEQLKLELNRCRAECADFQKSQKQLTEIRQDLERKSRQAAAELVALQSNIAKLEQSATTRDQAVLDNQQKMTDLTNERDDAKKDASKQASDLKKTQAELEKLKEKLKATTRNADGGSHQFKEENEKLSKDLEAVRAKAKAYFDELCRCRVQLGLPSK